MFHDSTGKDLFTNDFALPDGPERGLSRRLSWKYKVVPSDDFKEKQAYEKTERDEHNGLAGDMDESNEV